MSHRRLLDELFKAFLDLYEPLQRLGVDKYDALLAEIQRHDEDDHDDFEAMDRIARRCYATSREKGWHEETEAAREAATLPDAVRAALPKAAQRLLREANARAVFSNGVDVQAKLGLIHSEVSEALEAYRDPNLHPQQAYTRVKTEEGEQLVAGAEGVGKPEGMGAELADVVIRVFDLAESADIPVVSEIRRKMAYNATRPHRHGGKRA